MQIQNYIVSKTGFSNKAVGNTLDLLENDASIPFIARYRKDLTGNLTEVAIEEISELRQFFLDLEKRKTAIFKAIEAQNALTPELKDKIQKSDSPTQLEDLYLPFKKKRKTKAEVARNAGLEPLAKMLMAQNSTDIEAAAGSFVNKEIANKQAALEGAKQIVAEWINENLFIRNRIRQYYNRNAELIAKLVPAKKADPEATKFKQYFDWKEPLRRIPSHRFLALHRAEKEGFLKIKVTVDAEEIFKIISGIVIKNHNFSGISYIHEAIKDAIKRLLKPSFTTEFLNAAKDRADDEAIKVFASNLEQLLMAPPLGGKRILAIDPGFKSGCKVVCLDERGKLLHNENIYPHPPQKEISQASKKIRSLVNAYRIDAIAIGNGTASRETEFFIKKVPFSTDVEVFIVNEAGASVYSASKIARDEFPNYDITVRGSVSIGRRLSDPLSELVKIDPKSIGVGQYQHEVDQLKLKSKLDAVVMSCVNRIGVNVNTAGKELLSYVSGIGPSLAENIIAYRNENGNLENRKELLKVSRLGAKAYEQAAGFLRIKNPTNPLDDSAVHPESYDLVRRISKDQQLEISKLIGNNKVLKEIDLSNYVSGNLGMESLRDIVKELEKPGSDPRKPLKRFEFDPNVKSIQDLSEGMQLPGIVNNITNFGCFVDIGIKESGLVHISKLAEEFVSDVNSIVKLGQQVQVTVIGVDIDQKRVQLSMIA